MGKQFLDKDGLQVVANSVNKKLSVVTQMPGNPSAGTIVLYNGDALGSPYLKGHMYQFQPNDFDVPYYCYENEGGGNYSYVKDFPPTTSSKVYYSEGDNPPEFAEDMVEWNGLVIVSVSEDEIVASDAGTGDEYYMYRFPQFDVTPGGFWKDLSELKIYYARSFNNQDLESVIPYIHDTFFILTNGNDSMIGTTGLASGPGVDVPWTIWTLQYPGGFMSCEKVSGFHVERYDYMIDGRTRMPYLEILDSGKEYNDSTYYQNFIISLEPWTGLWGGMYKFYRMNRFTGTNGSKTVNFALDNFDYPSVGLEVYFDDRSGDTSCCYLTGEITAVDDVNNQFTVRYDDRDWICDSNGIAEVKILPVYQGQGIPYILNEMPGIYGYPIGFEFVYNGKTYTTEEAEPKTFKHGATYRLTHDKEWEEVVDSIDERIDEASSVAAGAMALSESVSDKATAIEQNLALYNSYSFDEKWTGGTWVDGKKIYKKTYDLGTVPSPSGSSVYCRIPFEVDFDTVVEIKGMIVPNENSTQAQIEYYSIPKPPKVGGSDYNVSLKIKLYNNVLNLELETKNELNNKKAYATVYYTKNN